MLKRLCNAFIKMPLLTGLAFLFSAAIGAHPMPNSVMVIDVKDGYLNAEVQLPLKELELAFGKDLTGNPEGVIAAYGPQLKAYLLSHLHVLTPKGRQWKISITGIALTKAEQTNTGAYHELNLHLLLIPPADESTRNFTLFYDAIVHQVVTHKTLIALRQDWHNGYVGETIQNIGVISMNVKKNAIFPLTVNLNEGSYWKGFASMLQLGIDHISEGTDHLLFLLVLLLPAPLLYSKKKWLGPGGTKYSLRRIIKIVTAFTIGHSVTLLTGALGWVHFPSQPVEILIAFSIFITALHAARPIFAGKEIYIAAGFGLIHGLAFATTLWGLNLQPGAMAFSILGFNLGIELMQLFIILMAIPWLIILSEGKGYTVVRITGAILAGVAAWAWIVERITSQANFISLRLGLITQYGKWFILLLALLAGVSYFFQKKSTRYLTK